MTPEAVKRLRNRFLTEAMQPPTRSTREAEEIADANTQRVINETAKERPDA